MVLVFPSLYFFHTERYALFLPVISFVFLTDFFDGFLARALNQKSFLGAILDPVADKVVVLVLFSYFYTIDVVPVYYFALAFTRDVSQLLSIPILLFWKKILFQVKPKQIPKWGTAIKFVLLLLLSFLVLESQGNLENSVFVKLNGVKNYPWIHYALIDATQFLFAVSALIEVYILVTFLPRFYQIYHGTHDTFE